VPDRLNDYGAFTRTHGGERGRIFVRAKCDCTVYVATAHGASGYDMLKWAPVKDMAFRYTDKGETQMQVYSRGFKAGEQGCVQQSGWTGTVVLLPKTVE
jgi:hypothetical protein